MATVSENDPPLALFRRLTNGLYVVGVAHDSERDAFTAAWITQVSFNPLLVALSVNPNHASFPLLTAAGAFAISILSHGQLGLARHFGTQSGRNVDKLANQRWQPAVGGAPVLSDAIGYLECRVVARHEAGDHELVLAQVVGGAVLARDALPMTYAETGNLDGSEGFYPPRF
jgi:flavin reductase (DIM6/NTAB) family NADH-FMN oxidoreductase RutF